MKFYLAATVSRWRERNLVRDILVAAGHEETCDWTAHGEGGSLRGSSQEAWAHAAEWETNGIREAEFFVGLLPGGIGTNAEVGMSSFACLPTFLHSTDPALFDCGEDGKTTTFYWHKGVRKQEVGESWTYHHYTDKSLEAFAHRVVKLVEEIESITHRGVSVPFGLRPLPGRW